MQASALKGLKCLTKRIINFWSEYRKNFNVNVLFGGSIKKQHKLPKIINEAFLTLELIIKL